MDFNEADSILDKYSKDYKLATRKVLAKWVTMTEGKVVDLKTCLEVADLSGLCRKVLGNL